MRLLISLDEVQNIVEAKLREKLPVKIGSAKVVSHIEGQYDDAQQVLDGVSFEIAEDTQ